MPFINSSDFQKGAIIGKRWVLGDIVGTGAVGTVFRVTDKMVPTLALVAKVISEYGNDSFRAECNIHSFLAQHARCARFVPKIHSTIFAGQRSVIVMEKLGESIRDVLRKPYRYSISQGVRWGLQIIDIVDELIAAGVHHNDITDRNLVLGARRTPVSDKIFLLDFEKSEITQKKEDTRGNLEKNQEKLKRAYDNRYDLICAVDVVSEIVDEISTSQQRQDIAQRARNMQRTFREIQSNHSVQTCLNDTRCELTAIASM